MNDLTCSRRQPLSGMSAGERDHVVLAKLLAGYRELVTELGGRPAMFLDSVGITRRDLDNPFALVPVRAAGQLLEDSAARLGCPDFGLRLAERQAMEAIMQPLDQLFRSAPSVRAALECCSRHVGAYNSGLTMELDGQGIDSADFDAECATDETLGNLHMVDFKLLDGLSLFPQMIEQLLLLTHNSIIWLSAGFARSRAVWFSHLNISAPVVYARRFNAVIRFGQEYDAILFSDVDLATRIAECNADLFATEARAIAERFPERNKDITARVREAIFRALTRSEDCTRQHIARMLGFQERTLNRHLFKMGTSFEAIRDDVRRDLAFRYLARADLPLTEIAGRLGYSELAVLSRCCRRWFGLSPRQLRQELLTTRLQPLAATFSRVSPALRISA
jgi:AraC-like DNA-binding protein